MLNPVGASRWGASLPAPPVDNAPAHLLHNAAMANTPRRRPTTPTARRDSASGLWTIRHYRLFQHARLELHPSVTVLVGLENDTGKSTLLDALRLYGHITQTAGFRGPLSEQDFWNRGAGDAIRRRVNRWRGKCVGARPGPSMPRLGGIAVER